ncbi:hypothetical protein KKF64_01355 [Patescibacteria group bacterium]|nr:hypothetical protein [Patescibacteria group bacterium]
MEKHNQEEPKEPIDIPPMKLSYLLKGFALSAMISGYIIGPLLVIGGGTWWLYKNNYVDKIVVIISVLIAFAFSNWLIIVQSKKMLKKFNNKMGIKDPSREQVKEWKKNRPESYQFDDEEEEN